MLGLKWLLAALIMGPVRDVDLNFDNLPGFKMPSEWELGAWGYAEGYRAEISGDASKSGQYCLMLRHEGEQDPEGSGSIFRKLVASEYHGKRVVFRAAVRVMDAGSSAQLMLRGKTQKGQDLLLAGTVKEPIRDTEWRLVELFANVRPEITELEISIRHKGRGRIAVDDVELKTVGELPIYDLLAPAAVGERLMKNYVVLGRVLGLLRYYHPSDQAAVADWGALARSGVVAVQDAEDSVQLAEALEQNFASVAPSIRLFPKGLRPSHKQDEGLEQPEGDEPRWAVRWVHHGLGGTQVESEHFSSKREREEFGGKLSRGWLKPEKPMDFDVGSNVIARIPTTLYADENGTLPHVESANGEPAKLSYGFTGRDRATRIAATMLAWNAIQHFAPVLGETKLDWYAALESAVRSASEDTSEEEFLSTLRQMGAILADGQVRFDHLSEWRVNNIPICWDWVDGQLVVTRISDSEDSKIGLNPGDVVLLIGGRSAEEIYKERCQDYSGSDLRVVREEALESMRRLKAKEPVKMRINSAKGKRIDVNYIDPTERGVMYEKRPAQYSKLRGGAVYCDLSRVPAAALPELLTQLKAAPTIIFDLRNGMTDLSRRDLLAHLIKKSVDDVEWKLPVSTRPNRQKNKLEKVSEEIVAASPRLEAQLIFLSDGSVMGEAEALLGIVSAEKLGKIVGETSAGAIGLVNRLHLPGDYELQWTASLAELSNGKKIHGKGIDPHVAVSRTVKGVTAGKDEVLQAALTLVK